MHSRFVLVLTLVLTAAAPARAGAQQPPNTTPAPGQTSQDDEGAVRLRLPVLTVTAEKELEDQQKAPVSVTAVPRTVLEAAAVRTVSDAADFAPNTFFHEFTARKLSNPRFRGIGSSPSNPGVSTYIDGVPQLNANSSSIELADVDQIEFVRGPQSALYGRNALGGVVNVRSARPSLSGWTGSVSGPFGSFAMRDVRGALSGPVGGRRMGVGVAFGYSARDGFTTNDVTGNDLDSRSAVFAKAQWLWAPSDRWEARVIVNGERARDGDYALNDLGAVRANPYHAQRDFEGYTRRDLVAPTLLLRRTGPAVDISATTGLVWWDTSDLTDLDYSAIPLATRDNRENSVQFTQEARVASARDAAIRLSDAVALQWQAGVFVFTQDYEQNAVNRYAPFVLSALAAIPVSQRSPATLDDRGIGVYGRGTFVVRERVEATIGLRADYENKSALLDTILDPVIAPPAPPVDEARSFSDVSPQFTVAWHAAPDRHMMYATAARGFKAGGFNAASPAGSEAYDNEHSWNYEAGLKTLWFGRRLSLNAAAFVIDWSDMQLNVPNPLVPAQFFIANAADARSTGFELEMNTRVLAGCDFFAGFGYTRARFGRGSVSGGVDVSDHELSNTPGYTADFGGQYSVALTPAASIYARAQVTVRGEYYYDDANTQAQEAYSLTDFRLGARGGRLFGEAWIRNAFDTRYAPIAFSYPGLAPSGFVAEAGAPRTFGIRAGVRF